MKQLYKIYKQYQRFIWGIYFIITKNYSFLRKMQFLFTYLKIEMKRLLVIIFRFNLNHDRIFKYKVYFPNYKTFAGLFYDIFIYQVYTIENPDAPFIIDCGSNIGMSVLYFKTIYPNSNIIAFEPDEMAFEYLKKNVEINKLQNVQLNQAAINDKDGHVTFYSAMKEDHASLLEMSMLKSSLGKIELKSTKVKCNTLSRYIDRPIDFLKMDVQGAEMKVFQEISNSGKLKQINEFVVEVHYDTMNNPLGQLLSIIEKNDFYYSFHQIKNRLPPYFKHRGLPYCFVVYASKEKNKYHT